MSSDPEPYDLVAPPPADRAVGNADTGGIQAALFVDLLELETWMEGV